MEQQTTVIKANPIVYAIDVAPFNFVMRPNQIMVIRATSFTRLGCNVSIFMPSNLLKKNGVRLHPLSGRRCFANKNNRSWRIKQSDEKKKKFFSSPKVFGTPATGLILPNTTPFLNDGSMTSNKEIIEKEQRAFAPLVDQGVHDYKIDDVNISSPLDKLDLTLSHSNTSSMIDLASMYDPKIHLPLKPNFSDPSKNYEVATPLGEELMKYIGVLGAPITMAEYMKRCLRDENHGYYTNPPQGDDFDDVGDDDIDGSSEGRGHRLIGQAGDFVTAPEISQIFGECLTIWLLTQYEALGNPSRIQLVELGPGRGTLMCDILRSASGIKGPGEEFIEALGGSNLKDGEVHGVHFVEVSDSLRITQREALENLQSDKNDSNSLLKFYFVPWKNKIQKMKDMELLVSKLREKKSQGANVDAKTVSEIMAEHEEENSKRSLVDVDNASSATIPIHWHDTFDSVPSQNDSDGNPVPTFIIGQEFFDALPVHVFQKCENGWREHLVDVAVEEDSEENKVEVQMRDGSVATTTMTVPKSPEHSNDEKKKTRFRNVLSPDITPALRNLLHIDENGNPVGTPSQAATLNEARVGTVMEVCPESLALIQDIALRIEKCRGAALMIDYGNEGSRDSLRAFRKHEQVDILSSPGTVDLTADVDFGALRNAVNHDLALIRNKMVVNDDIVSSKNKPEAFGPTTQGNFLASMGAVERTIKLIEDDNITDEQAEELCIALERLISEEEMGERFKVLAIAMKKDGIFAPPGF